ncbi:hypothetical protein C2E31_28650 [Rhodopirellula baltica]|nr:hypothetical protein C2E31_28650 [Rhodopirellula baltica]
MSKRLKTQSNRTAWHWVLGAVVVLAAIAWAISTLWWSVTKDNDPSVANETTTAGFFVSLAALDVEENERAARVLDELVQAEPNEPALWANLAVAKLRLNDLESAKAALDQALSLAPTSRELLRLNAQYLEASGQVAAAIDVLRELHQQWPENIRVAFNLSTLLGQVSSETADEERLKLLSGILQSHPQNLRVRCESARLAATVSDSDSLRNAITWLKQNDSKWSDAQQQQIDQAAKAIEDGNDRQAAVALTFFENLSKPSAAYQRSLDELGILSVTAVGTPVRSFLSLNMPPAEASPADLGLQFSIDASPGKAARLDLILGVDQPGERCSTLLSLSGTTIHIQGSAALPFPGYTPDNALACLAWADLNDDFRPDLVFVGEQGWRVYLADDTEGFTELESPGDLKDQPWKSVWQSDVEADGDLDLFLSDHIGNLRCLQNDGAANLSAMENFPEIAGVIGFREIDFDSDGDIDYVCLDKKGNLTILNNQRGGRFTIESAFGESDQVAPITAITVADLNRNGHFEIVGATQSGQITTSEFDGETWQHTALLESGFSTVEESATKQTFAFLAAKDLDNNGAIDLVLSQANRSGVWLQGDAGHWHSIKTPNIQVTSVVDVDCDGLLDLVGQADHQPQLAINQSSANYQWHAISPQANTSAGDKRINSFGIGGTIEVRSGKTLQSQMIQSSRVHFGLGQHPQIDVARIVWPNGTSQAEFELANGQASVAAQRLKGSCPWVFTYDGTGYRFIKDFLWRSPLGLKINAQETAGVTQTEDRIKLPGESLVPHDGIYDIRITAELWETHFFDSVGLVAVDHPVDTEIFVDECFAPQREPIREVVVGTKTQPLKATFDMEGQSLDETLASNDGASRTISRLANTKASQATTGSSFNFPNKLATPTMTCC